MPRPRFDKLAPEKRERILEAAAQAFAANGYEGASLNQILDSAGISKGAAYYYFDDKADLFATVVEHYFRGFLERGQELASELDADNFWDRLADYYRKTSEAFVHRPWAMGLARAAWRLPPAFRMEGGPLERIFAQGMGWMRALIHRGRELGLIRRDLPEDLLVAWMAGLDMTSDRWMAENLPVLDDKTIEALTLLSIDTLRRLFDPAPPDRVLPKIWDQPDSDSRAPGGKPPQKPSPKGGRR
jgi:AcrR family transcriptional regulator